MKRPSLELVERETPSYRLDEQVGFLLRKASQRHLAIFARHIGDLTPPQFAALAKLHEIGETSQNQLGQAVAMDAATIKGVVARLKARGLVAIAEHGSDRRRLVVSLTHQGRSTVETLLAQAETITAETLAPLSAKDAAMLVQLLARIA